LGEITFEKDDWHQTLFIFSSTCLRCLNFSLEPLDYQQVKTICGNIVHAIASTNSLVSALEVSKLLASIHSQFTSFHEPRGPSYVSTGKREKVVTIKQQKRNPTCNSCSGEQYVLKVDLT
jgi:ubiquitin-like 1-activating enzyme E1 B